VPCVIAAAASVFSACKEKLTWMCDITELTPRSDPKLIPPALRERIFFRKAREENWNCCDDCDRVDPEDYGYCPDCDRISPDDPDYGYCPNCEFIDPENPGDWGYCPECDRITPDDPDWGYCPDCDRVEDMEELKNENDLFLEELGKLSLLYFLYGGFLDEE